MDRLTQPMAFVYDIGAPLVIRMPVGQLMQGDNGANTLEVTLTDGKKPADLSGYTAVGEVRREDGVRVTFECTISGSTIKGTLNADCYAYPGDCTATIQLAKSDGFRRTVLLIGTSVADKGDGPLIDGGNVIKDIAGIIAMMDEMRAANAESIEAAQTANTAAANADAAREAIQGDIGQLKDTKADAIMDTSARAAAHTLHAQRGPLAVTMYGKTTETGSGDKSPSNPYMISGVETAQVRAGGKNLLKAEESYVYQYGDSQLVNILSKDEVMQLAKIVDGNPCTISFDVVTDGVVWNASGNRRVGVETYLENTGTGVSDYDIGLWVSSDQLPATGSYKAVKSYNRMSLVAGFNKANPMYVYFQGVSSGTVTIKNLQIEISPTATAYEPYNANTYTLSLLPDGKPLHGNGTVDDTVENDCASGCDKTLVLNGTQTPTHVTGWATGVWVFYGVTNDYDKAAAQHYCDKLPTAASADNVSRGTLGLAFTNIYPIIFAGAEYDTVDKINAHFAANPLEIHYRSTEYTPDKDLRVCRVERKWKTVTLDGSIVPGVGSVLGETVRAYFPVNASTNTTPPAVSNYLPHLINYTQDSEHFYVANNGDVMVFIKTSRLDSVDASGVAKYFSEHPLEIAYQVSTPETYVTDRVDARKPDTLTTDTVTVAGSAETNVEYLHDTKHFIVDFVTKMFAASQA